MNQMLHSQPDDRHYSYRCISNPMGKRWSNGQAALVVLFAWIYASPPALLPYFEIWGRFVPGNLNQT